MAKKNNSGTPPKPRTTKLPEAIKAQIIESDNVNLQTIADQFALTQQAKLLRWRVAGTNMVVLLVDGRKFHFNLEEEINAHTRSL